MMFSDSPATNRLLALIMALSIAFGIGYWAGRERGVDDTLHHTNCGEVIQASGGTRHECWVIRPTEDAP